WRRDCGCRRCGRARCGGGTRRRPSAAPAPGADHPGGHAGHAGAAAGPGGAGCRGGVPGRAGRGRRVDRVRDAPGAARQRPGLAGCRDCGRPGRGGSVRRVGRAVHCRRAAAVPADSARVAVDSGGARRRRAAAVYAAPGRPAAPPGRRAAGRGQRRAAPVGVWHCRGRPPRAAAQPDAAANGHRVGVVCVM
ncbi:hypothetical protein H4R21_004880, partial [Coemansia helicoidea]